MGQNTTIEWCSHTFNPWIGCTKVSEGCQNCYAETLMDKRWGKVKWGPNGTRIRTSESNWREPLKWNRAAKAAGEKARVFCASLADVGEDRPELIPWRADLCEVIHQCDWLWFLLLTKRPENMTRLFPSDVLERCWLGTSVEDQKRANERIPHLLRTPASVRFLSCEPLLGEIDLCDVRLANGGRLHSLGGTVTFPGDGSCGPSIDWVIVGGESGPNARPMNVEWARSIVEQCKAAGTAVFVKQLGLWCTGSHDFEGWKGSIDRWRLRHDDGSESTWKRPILRSQYHPEFYDNRPVNAIAWGLNNPKGGEPSEWPEDLRIRQMPTPAVPA